MTAPRLFILRTLPRGSHLSGPDLQRRAKCRRHSLTLRGLGTQKGRGVPRGEPGSIWSVRTEDRRYYGESAPSGSLPGLTAVFHAPLSCLVSSLHFVPCRAGSSHRSLPGLAVCRSSEDVTYLWPASLWVCARSGFTFISPARASDCRGGQGQLGVGPQPRKVPWSGLVPSRPHQPWGIAPAERAARGCTWLPARCALQESPGSGEGS